MSNEGSYLTDCFLGFCSVLVHLLVKFIPMMCLVPKILAQLSCCEGRKKTENN